MAARPELFLDTSALFAGLWSATGGGRELLRLGELGLVTPVASSQVLKEIESVLRAKAPLTLGELALLLDQAQFHISPAAPKKTIQKAATLVHHPGDARVIADAWSAGVGFFVTLDRQHFLENRPLRQSLPFPIGTPGDTLAWIRDQLLPSE